MESSSNNNNQMPANLFPERRRKRSESDDRRGSSQSYTPSQTTTKTDSAEAESGKDSQRPANLKQRQGLLAFSNGQLTTKKPLVNPINRSDARRKALSEVAEETWELLPGLLATRPDVTNAGYLCQGEKLDPSRCPGLPQTTVRVIDSDTIDAALALQSTSFGTNNRKPVAILNMANANTAGGGWKHGALAQEEALCYRTSLIKTLHRKHYPLPNDAVIYSPTVLVIRDSIKNGHDLLDFRDPSSLEMISVVSCAAVCQPFLKKDSNGRPMYRDDRDMKLMKEKMRAVLRTAIRNKHQQMVLGALGCGAFGNPNWQVAEMWAYVLQEQQFQGGYWQDVIFAVLNDARGDNFKVFHSELDGLKI